jgi:hypothetical protein
MTTMTISNYEGTADTFTFPYNPKVYETTLDNNYTVTEIPFDKKHIFITGEGISPRMFILSGHMSGSDRFTNFRLLSKHIGQTALLKKLYFESDKFAIVLGKQCKQVNDGERTMFVDYVASFQSPVGLLFSDTQHTSGTNAGNASTFVEEMSGIVTSSSVDVTFTDGTNSFKIAGGALTAGDVVVVSLIKMSSSGNGIYSTEYRYVTINGTKTKRVQTTGGTGIITLAPGANITTVSITNMTSISKKFRDAWFM